MAMTDHMLLLLLLPAFAVAFPTNDRPWAVTTSGTLRGKRLSTSLGPVHQFLGVRYAQPPIKQLRFRPSQPLPDEEADKEVDAGHFGASCMQPPHLAELMYPQINRNESHRPISEDCLFLNIYAPPHKRQNSLSSSQDHTLPIIVWLPGEGYSYASARQYDGSRIALHGKVIVVTVNYRVSAFGFLSVNDEEAPGNVGLWDQVAALKWVRTNAHAFGGDPTRVTLVGRFSGAMSVTALIASPLAIYNGSPLFHRAIIQSGVAGETWTFDRHPMTGARKLAKKLGCSDSLNSKEIINCLRNIDADELNEASAYIHSWRLVLREDSLPQEPFHSVRAGKHLPIPVIIGHTDDEGSLCLLTHRVLKTPHLSKIMDDSLDREEFKTLARAFLSDYLADDQMSLVEEATREYETVPGTWRDRYVKLCGDGYIGHKTRSLARQLSIHGSRVYLYEFSHRPLESIHPDFVKGGHGDDILFVFGLVHDSPLSDSSERRLSDVMMSAWSHFASNGNPNPMLDSSEHWPPFSIDNKKYWEFSTLDEDKVKALKSDLVDYFWDSISEKSSPKTQRKNSLDENYV